MLDHNTPTENHNANLKGAVPGYTLRMTIFNSTTEVLQLTDDLIEQGGDISTPELEQRFNALFDKKNLSEDYLQLNADAVCAAIRENEARDFYLDGEAKRLAALAKSHAATAKSLRAALKKSLQDLGTTEMHTSHFKIALQDNTAPAPVIIDEDMEPTKLSDEMRARFIETKVEHKPNKAAIREALEAGEEISWATLLPKGQHIRIR